MKPTMLKNICGAALLLLFSSLAQAEIKLSDMVPLGPEVKVGQLANGLTYYIQKNGRPEKKVELRLVVKAGSILEDDDQLGLAHFTEHMAFNGSTHFKKHQLVSYLQSIGVKFGADLNAYTSFDETVYILPIPTDKKGNVETGFQVLQDWAQGLALNGPDIDAERAIIIEELRRGKGAEDRMNKVLLPKLLNGSRYAERLPIGREELLKSFSHDALKRFYRDWYRPNLMAVMVVGDIEPAAAEKMLRAHFSGLRNPARARPRNYAQIGARPASEGLVISDKEATSNVLLIRYPILPDIESGTFAQYREKLVENLTGAMLAQRMQELTQQANPPFVAGGSGMDNVVRGYRSFTASALVGKAGVGPAIDALVQEGERARQFGFTASELERSKKNLVRSLERAYNERAKSDSAGYVAEYIRHFLAQEPIPGIANEFAYVQELLPAVSLDEVNRYAARMIPGDDQKKLVVYMGAERAEGPIPAATDLLAAVARAEKIVLKAQDEKVFATRLMEPPATGTIVAEKLNQALGLTELTLGNGIKVILKPTDFKNDQVLLSSTRFGGESLFADKDAFNARYADQIVRQMGLKNFTPSDLQKVLAGKSVRVGLGMGTYTENFAAHAGSADVETMLQLVYLKLTEVRRDEALYQSFISTQQDLARDTLSRPESVLQETIASTVYNNHPRVDKMARPEDFDQVSLERALGIYKERFSSAKGMTFFLVGSFELAKVKPLIATYLGSLPTPDLVTAYRDLNIRPVAGVVKKTVYKGAEAKSNISLTFTGAAPYSEAEQMKLGALIEVLNIKLIEVLREKKGLIYGGGMSASLTKIPYGNYTISVSLPTAPESVDQVIAATFGEIAKVKRQGPNAADLDKVKRNWIQNDRKAKRENGYWMGQLLSASVNGTDPAAMLTYEKRVNALTAGELKSAAARYFKLDNYVQVVLYPEKSAAAKAANPASAAGATKQ